MNDLTNTLERAFPFDTSQGPGQIARELAKIDNDLEELRDRARKIVGKKKRLDKFIETFEATLADLEHAPTVTQAKLSAKAKLHSEKAYRDYLIVVSDVAEIDSDFEYLNIRRSIGQSILKTMADDQARYGKAAGEGSFQS